jgi:HK97 family phage major capsid protein
MKKSDELKQKRAAEIEAQKNIVKGAEAANRSVDTLTEDESKNFDAAQERIVALNKAIERAEASEANEALVAKRVVGPTKSEDAGEEREKKQIFKRASILKAIRSVNPKTNMSLDGAEKEMHELGLEENRSAKVDTPEGSLAIPLSYFSRATQQTVSQDSGAYGGALVQNQAPRIVDPLRPVLAVEGLGAEFITGLSGGDIPLVVASDFDMTFVAEGAAVTPQKKQYAGPTLSPKRAGGAVDISNRLIMQSSVSVENLVSNGLRQGFAQLLHAAVVNGAGGVAPEGLLQMSGIGTAAASAATPATWAQIVELLKLVEEADGTMDSLGFIIHPALKAALMQIKKDAGSGRFLLDENSNTIAGKNYVSTSQVPVLDAAGTDVYPIIYGDFSQMVIGQWGAINIQVDPYSANLSDSVRLVLNTHADMQIANKAAFAKNAFLTDAVS